MFAFIKSFSLLSTILIVVTTTTTIKANNDNNTKNDKAEALVEWIRSLGGTVDPRQEIRGEDPTDPTSLRGVFATADIPKGTVLVDLPISTIIRSGSDFVIEGNEQHDYGQCNCIWKLKHELELGNKSIYAPYINIMMDHDVVIPDVFTNEGQDLLLKVLGPYMSSSSELILGRHLKWFASFCGGDVEHDVLGVKAALLIVARGCDNPFDGGTTMAPYYDMYNHGNGIRKDNTVTTNYKSQFVVKTSKHIQAGEQIYNSYGSDVSHILSTYGFVEQQPQKWSFYIPSGKSSQVVEFSTDVDEETGKVVVTSWGNDNNTPPTKYLIDFLKYFELSRLRDIKPTVQEKAKSIPPNEASIILEYYNSMITAIEAAVTESESSSNKSEL